MNGKQLDYHYREYISNYREWLEEKFDYDYVLYKQNMGEYLSIDETSLSQGELYTILTNKDAKGKKGCLVAMIRGTKAEDVIFFLSKLPRSVRLKVKEITLDLSATMRRICISCFPNAELVSDRFHVQRLMNEAISDLRIDYRWEAIELENKEIELAKSLRKKHYPHTFENGDTRRQLLARSRHIVDQSEKPVGE